MCVLRLVCLVTIVLQEGLFRAATAARTACAIELTGNETTNENLKMEHGQYWQIELKFD